MAVLKNLKIKEQNKSPKPRYNSSFNMYPDAIQKFI